VFQGYSIIKEQKTQTIPLPIALANSRGGFAFLSKSRIRNENESKSNCYRTMYLCADTLSTVFIQKNAASQGTHFRGLVSHKACVPCAIRRMNATPFLKKNTSGHKTPVFQGILTFFPVPYTP
jgi:hypothetical protein